MNNEPTPKEIKDFEAENPGLAAPKEINQWWLRSGLIALGVWAAVFWLWLKRNVFNRPVVLLILLCVRSNAAIYYVDYASGSDAANGTSTAAPWQHAPGDASAGGIVPSSVNAGDVVLFHGGIEYGFGSGLNDCITLSASGTSGNPITYRSGHLASPQWGVTPAFINAANCGTSIGALVTGSQSCITIDGLTIGGLPATAHGSDPNYSGLISSGASVVGNNITVQNCTLTNSMGCGVFFQGLFDLGSNPSGITVSNCYIGNVIFHGIFDRAGIDNFTNVGDTFTNIGLDNIGLFAEGTDQMHNGAILRNWFGGSTNKSPIIVSAPITGLTVEANTVTGTFKVCTLVDMDGEMTNTLWANNLINAANTSFEGVFRSLPDVVTACSVNMTAINNTINYKMPFGAAFYFCAQSSTVSVIFNNLTIQNNIVVGNDDGGTTPLIQINLDAAGTNLVVNMGTFVCDNNVWNPVLAAAAYGFRIGGTDENGTGATNYTFADWQTKFGKDAHSTTSVPTYNAGTFIPANGDTVTANGANLIASLSTDIRDVLRPLTGSWTIGAYQFPGGGLPVSGLNMVGGGQILVAGGGQILVK